MPDRKRSRRRSQGAPVAPAVSSTNPWWRPGILVLAGVAAYWNSFRVPFVLDDLAAIVDNVSIREWWNAAGLLFPQGASPVAGRPVVNLSLAVNYAIGGLDVRGYHVWNLAIHAACALLMFGLVRRTLEGPGIPASLGRRSGDLALAAALVWALHPLNSEVIDYLIQRTESMMALFFLLTLYAGVRAAGPGRRGLWQVAAVGSCALGMACKESMATAPVVVVLYDRVFAFGSSRSAFKARRRFYAALAATWLVLAAAIWSAPRAESAGFATGVSAWTYLLNQTVIITEYLHLAVWPRSLVAFYGWPLPLTLGDVLPYATLILALLAVTILALVRWPTLGFLGAWFFITLAPASSIVPVATEVGAERRMYLPLMALVVLGAVAVVRLWDAVEGRLFRQTGTASAGAARWVAVAGIGVLCAALGLRTIARNREYSSPLSLARTIVERRPTPIAHHILGEQLIAAGEHQEGIAALQTAVAGNSKARYFLGLALFNQGRWSESVEQFDAFVRTWRLPDRLVPHWLEPSAAEVIAARTMMGHALARLQRWPAAAEQSRLILEMDRSNAEAYGLLANSLFFEGRYDEAAEPYRRYLQQRPNDVGALTRLGMALASSDQPVEALAIFRRAVEVDPRDGDARRNLAAALFDARDVEGAALHARQAVALKPDDPVAHDLLGRALAVQGRFDEAISEFERSLAIDPSYADAREGLAGVAQLRGARSR
jgi:tetratricopeptide (TPR) repeat protein